MASNYFSKQNPTDISLQSEDGGGLTLTKNGKFLFGAKLQEITDELNETSFDGVVDINPNTNSSYIGIMNANSEPVDVDIPNNNQYSLFNPPEDNIVFINPPQDDCDNEFDDIADALLKTAALFYGDFDIPNNNIDQDVVKNISQININKFNKAKTLLLNYFWNENKAKRIASPVSSDPELKVAFANNPDKFIIKNLPPGLRGLILWNYFSYGAPPPRLMLVTAGPDFLNLKDSNNNQLGLPIYEYALNWIYDTPKDTFLANDKDGNLTNEVVYEGDSNPPPSGVKYITVESALNPYISQFTEIINYYNSNKELFLQNLKQVVISNVIKGGKNRLDRHLKNKKINRSDYDNSIRLLNYYEKTFNAVYDAAIKYINCPPSSTTTPTTTTPATSTPTPTPTPAVSLTAQQLEEGIYEANFLPAVENEGSQIYDYVIYTPIAPSNYPPSGLVIDGPLVPYKGSSNLTVSKGGKLVLNVGVLVGATGDVNQEIHLPHFDYRGKELPDRYRGLIPVKQVTFGDVISFADFITALKRVGLNEAQARSCMALTGAESQKNLKRAMFTGYNFNIYGLQAEGKWSSDVNQYISYRYIAQDSADNVNTGEKTSLRIFAGFENIDNAIAAKTTAMNRKGFLDTTDKNDWAKKYQCTWVASKCNDAAALANAAAIYDTWGIRYFNKYKGTNY